MSKSKICRVPNCPAPKLEGLSKYNIKHKICELHLKSLQCDFGDNLIQRFCQKCTRFHEVDAFDEARRSCKSSLDMRKVRHKRQREQYLQQQKDAMMQKQLRLSLGLPPTAKLKHDRPLKSHNPVPPDIPARHTVCPPPPTTTTINTANTTAIATTTAAANATTDADAANTDAANPASTTNNDNAVNTDNATNTDNAANTATTTTTTDVVMTPCSTSHPPAPPGPPTPSLPPKSCFTPYLPPPRFNSGGRMQPPPNRVMQEKGQLGRMSSPPNKVAASCTPDSAAKYPRKLAGPVSVLLDPSPFVFTCTRPMTPEEGNRLFDAMKDESFLKAIAALSNRVFATSLQATKDPQSKSDGHAKNGSEDLPMTPAEPGSTTLLQVSKDLERRCDGQADNGSKDLPMTPAEPGSTSPLQPPEDPESRSDGHANNGSKDVPMTPAEPGSTTSLEAPKEPTRTGGDVDTRTVGNELPLPSTHRIGSVFH